MPTNRRRVLELALEALEYRRDGLNRDIAGIDRALEGGPTTSPAAPGPEPARRRPRFSNAERARRSARMKALWEKRWKRKRA